MVWFPNRSGKTNVNDRIGPTERLKTGARDLNIETELGRAEFFALPINLTPNPLLGLLELLLR
jgi:hypothetical protein